MKRKICFLVLTVQLAIGCAPKQFLQILNVTSNDENIEVIDNVMTFKNDIISISYDFWSEGGRVSFLIKNNSDKDIYLNLDRSHLIKNGIAFDYFLQRTYSQSKTYGSSSSLSAGKEKSLNAQASKNIIYMGEPMNIGASSGSLSFTTESSTKFEQYSEGLTCKEQAVICIPARSAKYFTEFNITSEVYKEDQLQIAPKTESSIIEFNNSDSPIL